MDSQTSSRGTDGASSFDPDTLFECWSQGHITTPKDNDLRSSIISTFSLTPDDSYVYHAIASVTLSEVQAAIDHGAESGLHAWYVGGDGKPLSPPSQVDIAAYTSIFAPQTSPEKVLKGFSANAKKGSIRSHVASYLQSHRVISPCLNTTKSKKHVNPYYDFWAWSCSNLEWAGPSQNSEKVKISHHILPVFMHHFGCVVPSYEALETIKHFTRARNKQAERAVIDMGSGNGYWTYMLRRLAVAVDAVDNQQSKYRTLWIDDTITAEGEKYLRDNGGCKEKVLLLVYPIVSADFTARILNAYKGDTIVVVGTQNANGYTAFRNQTIATYMSTRKRDFELIVQFPLPSFAGKDEALFVFERNLSD
ncbi:hypothetical protein ACLMJK_001357 [Lecanora helva]